MFSKDTFKKSVGWMMLSAGIFFYILAFGFLQDGSFWMKASEKIADVLVIGAVVGYLTGIAQWAGIFKKELQDVIYSKTFIGTRKDIEDIWHKTTKQLLKHKFSEIHRPLMESLKATLPGDNDISYYQDYDADIKLEWVNKDAGIVKCTEVMSFNLVAESTNKFKYPLKTWTYVSHEAEGDVLISSPDIEINGASIRNLETNTNRVGKTLSCTTIVPLKGNTNYNVKYTREKIYPIYEDYFIGLKSAFIIHNLTVELSLPDGIVATFIPRGTTYEFEEVKNSKQLIKMRYKGVVFPKQGYIFALHQE